MCGHLCPCPRQNNHHNTQTTFVVEIVPLCKVSQ